MKVKDNYKRMYRLLLLILTVSFCQGVLRAQSQVVSLPNGQKVILYSDKTWDYHEEVSYDFDFKTLADNKIPDFLRQGISVSRSTVKMAVEMYLQGWKYTMPVPKSSQASWGNYDGRTTWWKGYWYNSKTQEYSRKIPEKQKNGYYYGYKQKDRGSWRNGGSPSYPSKIDWLLSSTGGVKPQ